MRKVAIFCALLILWVKGITCLSPLDEEREAWKKIYDHWQLGKFKIESRYDNGEQRCRNDDPCYYCNGLEGWGSSIQCNKNKFITTIYMPTGDYEGYINGSIPVELGKLTQLKYIDVRYQHLSGSLPTEIGNSENLERLYLSNNQLSGSIPSSIGNLKQLKELQLYGNQLSGSIPSSIGNLKNLEQLDLSNNQISDIPSSIVDMIKLKILRLASNDLLTEPPPSVIEFCQIIRCDGINNFVWLLSKCFKN